jgi:hypothetical protein
LLAILAPWTVCLSQTRAVPYWRKILQSTCTAACVTMASAVGAGWLVMFARLTRKWRLQQASTGLLRASRVSASAASALKFPNMMHLCCIEYCHAETGLLSCCWAASPTVLCYELNCHVFDIEATLVTINGRQRMTLAVSARKPAVSYSMR